MSDAIKIKEVATVKIEFKGKVHELDVPSVKQILELQKKYNGTSETDQVESSLAILLVSKVPQEVVDSLKPYEAKQIAEVIKGKLQGL